MIAKRKLNFRFHNPNTPEETAGYILRVLIEANRGKLEQAIQERVWAASQKSSQSID